MDTKFLELMVAGKYEAAFKWAFSVSGSMAGELDILNHAEMLVGHSFAYFSDISEDRDYHFRSAAEFISGAIMSKDWEAQRQK